MVSTTIAIIQKDNIFGLWKGITPVSNITITFQDKFAMFLLNYCTSLVCDQSCPWCWFIFFNFTLVKKYLGFG